MIVSTPTPVTRGSSDRCVCYCEMQPKKEHVAKPASQRVQQGWFKQADGGRGLPGSAREPGYNNRGSCSIIPVLRILSPALLGTVFQQANAADLNQQKSHE